MGGRKIALPKNTERNSYALVENFLNNVSCIQTLCTTLNVYMLGANGQLSQCL